jgi:(S)-sulfolactate dehydrogenase
MASVVITEFMEADVAKSLTDEFGGIYDPTLVERRDEIKTHLGDCRALIVRNKTQVNEDLLASAPNLKVVGRLGVGLDNIDLDACRKRKVEVRPAVGTNHVTVAEYALGAMLLLSRPLFFATSEVVNGKWPRTTTPVGRELAGQTLGLVGFGLIARTLATRARALGMYVQAFDPMLSASDTAWADYGVKRLELAELAATSNILSLHVPLTPQTKGMVDAAMLSRLPKGALLVNSARGGIVDEVAVAEALRSGQLGGAALDVFEAEPLTASNPFHDAPNLILSPHLAGLTDQSAVRISQVVAGAVRQVLNQT